MLLGYGTGAIMAVPAHDERDFEFARKFGLPIREVVRPADGGEAPTGFAGEGIAMNSPLIDGLPTAGSESEDHRLAGRTAASAERTINYKLRDWLFSRQRYWGEPFPIVWENGKHRAFREASCRSCRRRWRTSSPPARGEPPLAKATDWVRYSETATRETNTMPQWAGSCWYYLRYCDPRNGERFVGEEPSATGWGPARPEEIADETKAETAARRRRRSLRRRHRARRAASALRALLAQGAL